MDRREFIRISSNAVLAGAAVHFIGCGTQLGYSDGLGSGKSTDHSSNITAPDTPNHFPGAHIGILTQDDVSKADALQMSIRGHADHDHVINLSSADLMNIGNGLRVQHTCSDSSSGTIGTHNHTVTFN